METLKFRTNAKCGGCVARIGEQLDKTVGKGEWNIDLSSPDKVLTVVSDRNADEIAAAVAAAGFRAERL